LNRFLLLLLIFYQLYQISCTPVEEIIEDNPDKDLIVSIDTILFDTLFTTRGSATRRMKVFNPNPGAVNIDRFYLGRLADSPFEIAVSGVTSHDLANVQILGQDSLLVLIKVLIDPGTDNLPFLVKDSIILETNNNMQDVKLIAWGQNAKFLGDSIIPCDETWTAELPYVIYKSILVDSLCKLSLEAGTRIYAAPGSFIYVKGTMEALGDSSNLVSFEQERQELRYENVPGQWGGIYFLEGSRNNMIRFTTIRNAQFGLRIGSPDNDTIPDVYVYNTKIENMTDAGVMAFTSDLYMENCLIDNCGIYSLANIAGGNYHYNHCTFASYSQFFFRNNPSIVFSDNVELSDGSSIIETIQINLVNSILWGVVDEEIQVSYVDDSNIQLYPINNIVKTSLTYFEGNGNQLSNDTDYMIFKDPLFYDFRPDSLSNAVDNGIDIGIAIDLPAFARDNLPDIGAYEFIPVNQ